MDINENTLVIYGCGGHGRSIASTVKYSNPTSHILFVDENAREGETIYGFDVVRENPLEDYQCIVALGDNLARKKKYEETDREKLISVVSTKGMVSPYATIGHGCFIAAFAVIGTEATIGNNTTVSANTVIGHETAIGPHCYIGPGVTIAGRVRIGELVYVGAGATVIDKITICSNVIIGAGATVVKDITVSGTYVGTPARLK